jgi:predicted aspartyl protease
LIYLKGFVGCLQVQVLVDNGATLSFINEKFAQKLPMKYTLRKFMITLGNGQACYTNGKVSLDLRLTDGMSFKTHLQVIHA